MATAPASAQLPTAEQFLQSMIGNLAGQNATLSVQLNAARVEINRLQQQLGGGQNEPKAKAK